MREKMLVGKKAAKKKRHIGLGRGLILSLGASVLASAVTWGVPVSCTHLPEALAPASSAEPSSQAKETSKSRKPSPDKAEAPQTYADAIRRRQFEQAASLMDRATSKEQSSPEVRYARAIVSLELNDVEGALRSVDKLDEQSPLFALEAEEIRLEAAKLSQDVTLLEHFLGASKSPRDTLLLAEAHQHSSSGTRARVLAKQVLKSLEKSKRRDRVALRARAHIVIAETLVQENKKAAAAKEYRWLATSGIALDEAATVEDGPGYDAKLAALQPGRALTKIERIKRAESFSKRGLVLRTEKELSEIVALSGAAYPKGKSEELLAWAVYSSRTDYLRASQHFAAAASQAGVDRRKNLYYEAKALARSNRDADAIAKYEKVARMGGTYADHSAYQAARLRFIDGQWKAASQAYEKYLKRFGKKAKHRDDAESDLPVARLAAEDYANAVGELKTLIANEKSPRERARLMQLQAVAYLGLKKTDSAAAQFRRVIDYRPLSYPAMLSASRLRQMGQSIPPRIPPSKTLSEQEKTLTSLSLSLPEKAWRLSRVGLDEKAEKALRAEETRLKKQYGSRSGEALCRLYGQFQSAKRRFQVAQTAASWSVLRVAPNSRSEWQWDCIYPSPYREIVEQESRLRQVPSGFVYGIMRQESAFRPTVVSPAAAVGLMQIIPPTASRIAEEMSTTYAPHLMRAPAINIKFGTYYIRRLLDMFGDRPELAAASYNAGPHAVTRWLRAGEKLPMDIFVARIPYKETRNYVYRVMGNYARYAYRNDKLEIPTIDLSLPQGLKAPEEAY